MNPLDQLRFGPDLPDRVLPPQVIRIERVGRCVMQVGDPGCQKFRVDFSQLGDGIDASLKSGAGDITFRGKHEVVDSDVPPPAAFLVDDLDSSDLPVKGLQVPRDGVHLIRIRSGGCEDDLAINQEIDARLPRMCTAPDQESQRAKVDRNLGRGERANVVIASPAVSQLMRVHEELAARTDIPLSLSNRFTSLRSLAKRIARAFPSIVVTGFEVLKDQHMSVVIGQDIARRMQHRFRGQ